MTAVDARYLSSSETLARVYLMMRISALFCTTRTSSEMYLSGIPANSVETAAMRTAVRERDRPL